MADKAVYWKEDSSGPELTEDCCSATSDNPEKRTPGGTDTGYAVLLSRTDSRTLLFFALFSFFSLIFKRICLSI